MQQNSDINLAKKKNKKSKNSVEKSAKSSYGIYQVKAKKNSNKTTSMPRKHTLLTIPGIRSNRPRIKKRCQNLPRGTKLIASKKLTFDWLAQKFR